jgi:hypothetical protein
MMDSVHNPSSGQSVELLSIDGRLQHCGICGKPVLGLFGQDQMVTERMLLQTQSSPLPVDIGWFHTLCILDVGIGKLLFEARVRSLSESEGHPHSDYFVSYHAWLEEFQICSRDGSFWLTTLDNLQSATQVPGGVAVPVEHDVDVCVVGSLESLTSFNSGRNAIPVSLESILNDLGISRQLSYPSVLAGSLYFPSPSSSASVLAGRLKYHLFLPGAAVRIVQRMRLTFT